MVSAPNGPDTAMPCAAAASIAGLMISISSEPNSPPSPACGLSPLTAIFGAAMPICLSVRSARVDDARDFVPRDRLDRLAHALMQRGMRDLDAAEAQHHEHVVLVGAGLARHERRMAVELDAGLRDRGLVLRRATTASTSPASAAFTAAPTKAIEARPAIGLVAPKSSFAASGCLQSSTLSLPPEKSASAMRLDHSEIGGNAAGLGVTRDHARIAHQNRIAGCAHGGIERGLEADLRPDAGGVAGGDGDFRFVARHENPLARN